MKLYYFVKDSERMGPCSFSQLQAEGITQDTLVWFEGLPSWQFAKDLSELKEIFEPKPVDPDVDSIPAIPLSNTLEEDSSLNREEGSLENKMIAEPIVETETEPVFISKKQGLFSNPFGTKGRIRRTEYWLSIILVYVYIAVIGALNGGIEENANGDSAIIIFLFCIPAYWFIIAQSAKRCHDRGNSGWFQIIPFYGLWMAFGEGDYFDNEYGTNPKR